MEAFFFIDDTTSLAFKADTEKSFLPFPVNQSLFCRLLISAVLVYVLVLGCKKRLLIAAYLKSPEVKLNPPNVLFCLDQVNGIFMVPMFLFFFLINTLSEPLSELTHPKVCAIAELIGGLYISGTIVWRCHIAIFKLLCVKGQRWLKRAGANKILAIQVAVGLTIMVTSCVGMINGDKDSFLKRSCFHKMSTDLEILYGLQVSLLKLKCDNNVDGLDMKNIIPVVMNSYYQEPCSQAVSS